MKRSLSWVGVGLVLVGAFVGCGADGETGIIDGTDVIEPEADGGTGSTLPPPSNDPDDEEDDSDGGKDAGKKDGSVGSGGDAGKDSGPSAPSPGAVCTNKNQIASRMCGKCGKQETICQTSADEDTDGGTGSLVWSEYGSCGAESGICLPGETRPCGDCGTQTCNSFCGWGACTGEPANHCSPGAVEFTGAGCPTGGLKNRTCTAQCQWSDYTSVCDSGSAVDLWAGPYGYSTFMRDNNGDVYAWGQDDEGQLFDNDTANKSTLVLVPALQGVASIQIGGGTTYGWTCASFSNGSAKCWGYNSSTYGLGDGTTYDTMTGVTPTGFGANLVSVGVGNSHGCGLFADGSAKCWGRNTDGELGRGNTTTSKTPVAVDLTGITQLSVGYQHNCARKGEEVYCWGYNNNGQLGDGTTTDASSPLLVLESGAASVVAGYLHTCSVMTDGTAMCWGDGLNGKLGNNSAGDVSLPTMVLGIDGASPSLTNVSEMCVGGQHTCARLTDGRVACWGDNANGQLGTGNTTDSLVPKIVPGITTATKLVCGYLHTCVIDNGYVKCWGDNNYRQVGNGATTDATSPQIAKFN